MDNIFIGMTNTYTQINIHYVFAVKYRAATIESSWETRLHKYITGIFENNGTKLIQFNGTADHLHILTGLNVNNSISSIVGNVKAESSRWINNEALTKNKFAWQEGYGAFSYSASQLPDVIRYIQNQKIHHRNYLFKDEYKALLKAFEIPFEERFVFHEPV
jgi:putative transposase